MKDIKHLPFEDFFANYSNMWKERSSTALKMAVELATRAHNKSKASAVAIASTLIPEAGSDGLEEDFDETYGYFDPSSVKIPDEELDNIKELCRGIAYEKFVKDFDLNQAHSWFPFQLINHFGNWTPVLVDGLYNAEKTREANINSSYEAGIYQFALGSISPLFKGSPREFKQYNSPISPIVPIILAGLKQNKDIKYSQWSREGIESLVPKALANAMLCDVPDISFSELIQIRNIALSDLTTGILRNTASSVKLNRVNESMLRELPRLAKYMVLQTWVAHPNNRHKNAILDPRDWDNLPEPLVDVMPISTERTKTAKTNQPAPWE